MKQNKIKLLYIDLFCGAGGTSTGVEKSKHNGQQIAKVIACVNHDANAIASHESNHPEALHFTEDIRTLDLSELIIHVNKMRVLYPDAKVVLWASLECTNFSKAKGGMPRDADSRTLAEHLHRYIVSLNPDYIQIENVVEFMSWGDLDANGKPISKDKGRAYTEWLEKIKYGYGKPLVTPAPIYSSCYDNLFMQEKVKGNLKQIYHFNYKILNSADYGAYTSRSRYFGVFAKDGLPISFPEATHTKNGGEDLFSTTKRWKAVKEVLDLSDEGKSIFNRKKPLSEKTLERIYAGLIKFVANNKNKWILKYNSTNGKTRKHNPPSIDNPCPTVATQGRLGVVSVVKFLSKQYSGHPESKNISIEQPAGAITCIDHHAFVSAYYGNGHNHSITKPAPTLTTRDRLSLIYMQYVTKANSPTWTIMIDSPMTIKIKEFMQEHNIVDICMRMLKINELKQIQGFPKDYTLIGTQAEQKKFIGNAVEVNTSRALCEATFLGLLSQNIITLKQTA